MVQVSIASPDPNSASEPLSGTPLLHRPALPQPGESEQCTGLQPEQPRLLGRTVARPFVEPIRRDQAASRTPGRAERRFGVGRLGPRIDHPITDVRRLRPRRDQPPVQHREATAVLVPADGRDFLPRRDVVARPEVRRRTSQAEISVNLRPRMPLAETSTHKRKTSGHFATRPGQ